ncbi:uncharacterized protein SPSK_10667 [Sporothrix schenckii 1099-18]|uniref:Uncharacterized protein n=1 Tax=Sporothrix schenckii 1099-18 TaxID=1397361 RepID=A0A0F2LTJ8_SPOSC|nr:uncharacterized protein SPSK_10667 [Sporothrix schenckii 1099-18]KJR80803.1 hypothetical protein SPSK_10667 [Sporothrix schenckii 1099-18]
MGIMETAAWQEKAAKGKWHSRAVESQVHVDEAKIDSGGRCAAVFYEEQPTAKPINGARSEEWLEDQGPERTSPARLTTEMHIADQSPLRG